MVGPEPTIHTISHEKSSTTMVRMAVAASESVFRMPHLARIAVNPANSAEANAKITHITNTLLSPLKDTNSPQKCRCGICLHILTLNVGSVYPKRSFFGGALPGNLGLRGEKICGKIEKKVCGGTDMEPRILLETLAVAERLKDTTRHCYTRKGRHESVAEHCWMMTLMAYFVRDEFPEADMDKVIRMCLIHDLGEAFTGDIPSFDKTAENEKTEERLLRDWVDTLPEFYREEMTALYGEMEKRETLEAKIYKAIDNLEAVIQHNISDLATWIPKEYELNKTYGDDKVAFSEYLRDLRAEVRRDTERKLGER